MLADAQGQGTIVNDDGSVIVWTGAGDGTNWKFADNWNLGVVPDATHELVIIPDLPDTEKVVYSTISSSINDVISREKIELASGTMTIEGTASIENDFILKGGTLAGGGEFTVSVQFAWSGGNMEGTGTTVIASGATGTISGTANKWLGRTLQNAGTVDYSGTRLYFGRAAGLVGVIDNLAGGRFDVTGEGDFSRSSESGHAFHNAGTFNKSGAGTTTIFTGVAFNNSGTVNVQSGRLEFGNSYLQTAGATTLSGGEVSSTAPLVVQGGLFTRSTSPPNSRKTIARRGRSPT